MTSRNTGSPGQKPGDDSLGCNARSRSIRAAVPASAPGPTVPDVAVRSHPERSDFLRANNACGDGSGRGGRADDQKCCARGYPLQRADKNTIANTTIHPTMTKEAAAPAVILSFSLVVVRRMQGLSSRPLMSAPCRRISCTARDRSCGRSGPAALPLEIRCHCMPRIYVRPDSRVVFSFLNLSGGGRDRQSAGPSQARQRYRCQPHIATPGRSTWFPGAHNLWCTSAHLSSQTSDESTKPLQIWAKPPEALRNPWWMR
jgi:hypothetical protein